MKIKIIDLLNMISNGEKLPKNIKFENYIYNWRNMQKDYFCKQINHSLESIIGDYIFNNLNLEVEILDEEEFEDIEEIELTNDEKIKGYYNCGTHYMTTNVKDREVYIKLINQLIKNQKKLIDELNELKRSN